MSQKKKGKGSGQVKGALSTVLMVVVVLGAIVGWSRVNDISGPADAMGYFKAHSDRIASCGFDRIVANDCISITTGSNGERSFDFGEQSRVDAGEKTPEQAESDKGNSDTSKENKGVTDDPGASQPIADEVSPVIPNTLSVDKAVNALSSLLTVDKLTEVDYVRSEWRHWLGSPCNTRENVLVSTGTGVETDDKCRAVSGSWYDPYKGEVVNDASELDIDHVIPLGYAARAGGNEWSAEKKEQFANDPMHLLAVDAGENRSKSDKGPSDWMPRKDFRCDYSRIWVSTAAKYDLTIESDDMKELESALEKC